MKKMMKIKFEEEAKQMLFTFKGSKIFNENFR